MIGISISPELDLTFSNYVSVIIVFVSTLQEMQFLCQLHRDLLLDLQH